MAKVITPSGSTAEQAQNTTDAYTATYGVGTDGRKTNKPLHPALRPIAGVNGNPGQYTTGRIYNLPYEGDPARSTQSNYAFTFLYNPNSIQINTQVDWSINYDSRDVGTTLPNAQTLQFELMLNRITDVADPTPGYNIPNGTLHDIEYLYRTINGEPVPIVGMGTTADKGFIIPTRVMVAFGTKYKFVGYVNSISITHAMFQKDMIPVYTTVDISMSRALDTSQSTGDVFTNNGNSTDLNTNGVPLSAVDH